MVTWNSHEVFIITNYDLDSCSFHSFMFWIFKCKSTVSVLNLNID